MDYADRTPCFTKADAAFMAHSISDIPALLDLVDRLRAQRDEAVGEAVRAEREAIVYIVREAVAGRLFSCGDKAAEDCS